MANYRYGFGEFEVGDAYRYIGVNVHSCCVAAYKFAAFYGWKMKTKKMGDRSVLIWRVR